MNLTMECFNQFQKYIHNLCGITVAPSKKYLIEQRMGPLVEKYQCDSFECLLDKLVNNRIYGASKDVIEAITTNETFFFRDIHPFEAFKGTILPDMAEKYREAKFKNLSLPPKFRIWSAASSRGQEAYSIAMCIDEFINAFSRTGISHSDFDIVGTDISTEVIKQAASGIYGELELNRGVSNERRDKFFTKRGEEWEIKPLLKRMAEFKYLNLMNNFVGMGKFEIIFCRNVLIYFDLDARERILQQMHSLLRDDGYLILGSSENMYGIKTDFASKRIAGSTVYCKR